MPTSVENHPISEQNRKVPFTVFETVQSNAPDRFEAWRQSIGVMFDVEPLGKRPSPTFKAWVRTYHLGELLVAGTHFGDEQFSRSVKKISSDGLDHYQVQLYYEGGLVGETKHNQMKVRPGDIQIVDMAQPHISSAQGSSTIVLAVQRNALAEMLPDHTDPHGVILAGDRGAGALLADYIKSLYRRMDTVEAAEAPFIARATLHMLAACLQPSARTSERARMQIEGVIAERIKRYIGENVGARELSPAELCKRFRISRSQLYRIFEPLGGVANYIQARRLDRAFAQLRDPLHRNRKVFEIAFNVGFSSMAHFSGAFRRQFGMSPTELRAGVLAGPPVAKILAPARSEAGYEDWLRDLARRPASRLAVQATTES